MLISVNENDFKDKVNIRFNNITEGINRFEKKVLENDKSDDFEKSINDFRAKVPMNIYSRILYTDTKNKINLLKNYITV